MKEENTAQDSEKTEAKKITSAKEKKGFFQKFFSRGEKKKNKKGDKRDIVLYYL